MSDFIIAKSGEHFAYNSFGCSIPFYSETISLEHFHYLAFLSLLETVPVLLRPVFSCLLCGFLSLFLSLDHWYSIFMLSWTVSSNYHLHSMISVCIFLSSFSSRFHVSPSVSHRPLHFYVPECTSPPSACLISVDDVTQCPGQGPQNSLDPLFPLFLMFSQSPKLDGVTSQMYLFSLSTLLLPYLMPLSPIAIKMAYQ